MRFSCGKFLLLLMVTASMAWATDLDKLLERYKDNQNKIEQLRLIEDTSSEQFRNKLYDFEKESAEISKELKSVKAEYDNPVYVVNDFQLDDIVELTDLYMYDYTDSYYQVFMRLKNKQFKYLDWVKLRFNFYKNGNFNGTDYCYIDLESYGSSGISPYNETVIETYFDKIDFDSLQYRIEYDIERGYDDILWDQLLTLESNIIQPSGSYNRWYGIVKNNFNYTVKYPKIYALIFKNGRMVACDYTYIDVKNDTMRANDTGIIDSFIDLPADYDQIKYKICYSLYSFDGSGYLPPNKPIFTEKEYTVKSRQFTDFGLFVLDPNDDNVNLSIDFGDGNGIVKNESFVSNSVATVQYAFPYEGIFNIAAKADDGNLETAWSDTLIVQTDSSSIPRIVPSPVQIAKYKNDYSFQFHSNSGIQPISWDLYKIEWLPGLSFDKNTGILSGQPSQSGIFQFIVYCIDSGIPTLKDSIMCQLEVENSKPKIISPDTLHVFAKGNFSFTPKAEDQESNPVSFQYIDLPFWLSTNLNNNSISGTAPNEKSVTSFFLVASDGDMADTCRIDISIDSQPLNISKSELKTGIYKKQYSDCLIVSGGLKPYFWNVLTNKLPDGIEFDSTGCFFGLPNESGKFNFLVKIQDSTIPTQSDSLSINLEIINHKPQITSPDSLFAITASKFSFSPTVEDQENNPILFSWVNLPSWITVKDDSLVGQTPNEKSETMFSLIASDGDMADTSHISLFIDSKPLVLSKTEIKNGVYKNEYSDSLMISGGLEPYFWSISADSLPKGIKMDSTGCFAGTPTESGLFNFVVKVQDSTIPAQVDTLAIQLEIINTKPTVTSKDTCSVRKNDAFEYAATAIDPEKNPISYTFINYPNWLSVTESKIHGTAPAIAGDTTFTIIATDGELSDSLKVDLKILEPALVNSEMQLDVFKLYSNYPNPFNPTTQIQYDLPQAADVLISIYNINGKWVENVVQEKQTAGSHKITWQAHDLPSGTYFIHMQANEFEQTRKCLLIK